MTGNVEDAVGYHRDDASCQLTIRFLTTIKEKQFCNKSQVKLLKFRFGKFISSQKKKIK